MSQIDARLLKPPVQIAPGQPTPDPARDLVDRRIFHILQQLNSVKVDAAAPAFSGPLGGAALPVQLSWCDLQMGDADHILTAAEYQCLIVSVTSSVALTATRALTVPSGKGYVWFIVNATTGAQSLKVQSPVGGAGT